MVQLPRRVPATGTVEPYVLDLVPVSPGYFDVLGVPVLDGRAFGPGDAAGADPVIVLSESAARRFFGRADAAGRTLEVYPIAVAGVVGDVRYRGFREPPAETAYYALAQYPVIGVHLLVHGVRGFVPSASAVAAAMYDVEPGLALGEVRVVGEPGPGDVGVPTAEAFLAVLAGFAVLQMPVALYGAAAYSAARRRPEYALRAALGAAPVRLVAAALRESLLQTVLGLLAGAGLAAAAARVLPALVSAPGIHEPGVRAYLAGRRGCYRGCGGVVSGGGARRSAGRSGLGSPLWLIRSLPWCAVSFPAGSSGVSVRPGLSRRRLCLLALGRLLLRSAPVGRQEHLLACGRAALPSARSGTVTGESDRRPLRCQQPAQHRSRWPTSARLHPVQRQPEGDGEALRRLVSDRTEQAR